MRIFIIIFSCLLSLTSFSQLQTSGGQSAANLVQNVLLGGGVQVSNINYYGSSQAIGTFDATNASIGIDKGIILTTGKIGPGMNGPHGPNNQTNAGIDNGSGGYAQLSNLVGSATFNATLLEFDFIPYSDTVRFKYVFASEEYPEFVGSKFNDVFAFFISGPGISGTKNMAIIPGSSNPVTINTVNSGSNQAYYQSNGNGDNAPFNSNSYYVQYDGFTKPLEAVSQVICGEKYHLVIAIADVSDEIYDSGIFLEANSFKSNQAIEIDYQLSGDPYGDGKTMAQNCTSATITVTRSGALINQPLTIPIDVSGTAIEGLDYSSVPPSVTFAPGQTTVSFTIDALYNSALTQVVNLILQFHIENPCKEEDVQEIELFIKPVEPVEVTLSDTSLVCPGDPITLVPTITGGGGGYTYLWNTGETSPTISINPGVTQKYWVEVTDNCLNVTASDSATVTVPPDIPLSIDPSDDISEQCPFVPHTLTVDVTGGIGDYYYEWSEPNGNVISYEKDVDIAAGENTTYTIVVSDRCGNIDSAEVTITILSPPLEVEITPNQKICSGDSVLLTATPSGGFGNYYYYWLHSEETTQSVWVKPDSTSTYFVIVRDDCQTFQVGANTTVEVVQPTANFKPITDPLYIGLPITFENQSRGGVHYTWDFDDGSSSFTKHPNNTFEEPGVYYVELITTGPEGCTDTIVRPVRITEEFYLYIPNSFSPNIDRFNPNFKVSAIGINEFEIMIFNRWGEVVYQSEDVNFEWNGMYESKGSLLPIPDGTYIWKIEYKSRFDTDIQTKVGHVNVIR